MNTPPETTLDEKDDGYPDKKDDDDELFIGAPAREAYKRVGAIGVEGCALRSSR